jgi:pimeloyl-ACP methyl ester carboxylesterase
VISLLGVHLIGIFSISVLRDRSVSLQHRPTLIAKITAIVGVAISSVTAIVLAGMLCHKIIRHTQNEDDLNADALLISFPATTPSAPSPILSVHPHIYSFLPLVACLLCAFIFLASLFHIFVTLWIIYQRAVFLSPPPGVWDDPEEIKALNWVATRMGDIIPTIYMLPPSVHRQHREVNLCMLYSHGNAMDLADTVYTLRALAETFDCAVMGYEYPGYGMCSGGNSSSISEERCYAALEAAVHCLQDYHKLHPRQIILYGRSLGTGPSTHYASKAGKNLGGLILQSPLTSVIRTVLPECCQFVNTNSNQQRSNSYCCSISSFFLRSLFLPFDMFCSIEKIHKIEVPTLITHGKLDRMVPFSHGESLHAALSPYLRTLVPPLWIDESSHNDMPRPWLMTEEWSVGETDKLHNEKLRRNRDSRIFIARVREFINIVKQHKEQVDKEEERARIERREFRAAQLMKQELDKKAALAAAAADNAALLSNTGDSLSPNGIPLTGIGMNNPHINPTPLSAAAIELQGIELAILGGGSLGNMPSGNSNGMKSNSNTTGGGPSPNLMDSGYSGSGPIIVTGGKGNELHFKYATNPSQQQQQQQLSGGGTSTVPPRDTSPYLMTSVGGSAHGMFGQSVATALGISPSHVYIADNGRNFAGSSSANGNVEREGLISSSLNPNGNNIDRHNPNPSLRAQMMHPHHQHQRGNSLRFNDSHRLSPSDTHGGLQQQSVRGDRERGERDRDRERSDRENSNSHLHQHHPHPHHSSYHHHQHNPTMSSAAGSQIGGGYGYHPSSLNGLREEEEGSLLIGGGGIGSDPEHSQMGGERSIGGGDYRISLRGVGGGERSTLGRHDGDLSPNGSRRPSITENMMSVTAANYYDRDRDRLDRGAEPSRVVGTSVNYNPRSDRFTVPNNNTGAGALAGGHRSGGGGGGGDSQAAFIERERDRLRADTEISRGGGDYPVSRTGYGYGRESAVGSTLGGIGGVEVSRFGMDTQQKIHSQAVRGHRSGDRGGGVDGTGRVGFAEGTSVQEHSPQSMSRSISISNSMQSPSSFYAHIPLPGVYAPGVPLTTGGGGGAGGASGINGREQGMTTIASASSSAVGTPSPVQMHPSGGTGSIVTTAANSALAVPTASSTLSSLSLSTVTPSSYSPPAATVPSSTLSASSGGGLATFSPATILAPNPALVPLSLSQLQELMDQLKSRERAERERVRAQAQQQKERDRVEAAAVVATVSGERDGDHLIIDSNIDGGSTHAPSGGSSSNPSHIPASGRRPPVHRSSLDKDKLDGYHVAVRDGRSSRAERDRERERENSEREHSVSVSSVGHRPAQRGFQHQRTSSNSSVHIAPGIVTPGVRSSNTTASASPAGGSITNVPSDNPVPPLSMDSSAVRTPSPPLNTASSIVPSMQQQPPTSTDAFHPSSSSEDGSMRVELSGYSKGGNNASVTGSTLTSQNLELNPPHSLPVGRGSASSRSQAAKSRSGAGASGTSVTANKTGSPPPHTGSSTTLATTPQGSPTSSRAVPAAQRSASLVVGQSNSSSPDSHPVGSSSTSATTTSVTIGGSASPLGFAASVPSAAVVARPNLTRNGSNTREESVSGKRSGGSSVNSSKIATGPAASGSNTATHHAHFLSTSMSPNPISPPTNSTQLQQGSALVQTSPQSINSSSAAVQSSQQPHTALAASGMRETSGGPNSRFHRGDRPERSEISSVSNQRSTVESSQQQDRPTRRHSLHRNSVSGYDGSLMSRSRSGSRWPYSLNDGGLAGTDATLYGGMYTGGADDLAVEEEEGIIYSVNALSSNAGGGIIGDEDDLADRDDLSALAIHTEGPAAATSAISSGGGTSTPAGFSIRFTGVNSSPRSSGGDIGRSAAGGGDVGGTVSVSRSHSSVTNPHPYADVPIAIRRSGGSSSPSYSSYGSHHRVKSGTAARAEAAPGAGTSAVTSPNGDTSSIILSPDFHMNAPSSPHSTSSSLSHIGVSKALLVKGESNASGGIINLSPRSSAMNDAFQISKHQSEFECALEAAANDIHSAPLSLAQQSSDGTSTASAAVSHQVLMYAPSGGSSSTGAVFGVESATTLLPLSPHHIPAGSESLAPARSQPADGMVASILQAVSDAELRPNK